MSKSTLLVVDDVEMNRAMLQNIFEGDFTVLQAENGVEALKIIASNPVDILITDIFMPELDGYGLIRALRDKAEYRSIPIIAITESDRASRKKALKAGADDLIYKPFINTMLQARVKGLLFDRFDLNRYAMAYENNPVPFILHHVIDRPDTPNYKVMYLNRAAREAFSPSYTENLLQTDEQPELLRSMLRALRTGETQRYTQHQAGPDKWFDVVVYPDGTGLVASMVHDITEEINAQTQDAEQEAEQATKERNSTREILENIPGGIFVFRIYEDDTVIVEANSSGCRLLDVDPATILGIRWEKILEFLHPDDVTTVTNALKTLLTPGSFVDYKCRIFNRSKNDYVWFSAQAKSRLLPDGQIYAYINFTDITAERELDKTRLELLAAKKANAEKTQFLSRVSHDMRTPLNGILGMTALMKERITDSDTLHDLNQLQMSGKYLLNLITDTLDVNRIESGKLELHPAVCDGRTVFNNVISLINPNVQAKQLHFNIHADNLPFTTLYIDVGRLEQVIMNLLGNAVKFTPEGGAIDVYMNNLSMADGIITDRIVIKDTGIGMSAEFLPHLFEPFSQEHGGSTATADGTGLGMTICKQIVTLMNGTLEVESEVGRGTTFTLVLPFRVATEAQIKEGNAKKRQCFDDNILDDVRVLLCEDHPLNAAIATRLLEKKGALVEHAENGETGVEMFNNSSYGYYKLVLMDIRMPVMDGMEAARQIRKLPRPDAMTVPIVAMTANAFEDDIRAAKAAGMNAHLSKPIDTDKLYTTLEKMLHLRRAIKRVKILVVDDVEVNRAVLNSCLADDYTILEACNGKEALDILENTRGIDVVITDIQMPGIDGIELIKRIRSNPAYNQIAILANTQYGEPEQEEHLLALGATDFVYKPTTTAIVKSRVRSALRR